MYNNATDALNAIRSAANVDAVIDILNDVNTNYTDITFSRTQLREIIDLQSTYLSGNNPTLLYSGGVRQSWDETGWARMKQHVANDNEGCVPYEERKESYA